MSDLSPERKAERIRRIQAFVKKAEAEKTLPESYFAHLKYEIDLTAWQGFANIKAYFISINPVAALRYAFTREMPKLGSSRDMRRYASQALSEAAKLGNIKHAEGLISEMDADVNYLDKDGHTPLYHAVRRKRLGMAEMLLKHGADEMLASSGTDSWNPVCYAARTGFTPALDLFHRYGTNFNIPQKKRVWNKYHLGYRVWHIYPLAIALVYEHPKTCQKLLEYGANLDVAYNPNKNIRTIVTDYADCFKPETIAVFKKALANPQKVTTKPLPKSTVSQYSRLYDE